MNLLSNICQKILRIYENLIYNQIYKISIGIRKNVRFKRKVKINKKTKLEGNNIIYRGTNINNSEVGFGTYIASNGNLQNIVIGRFCSIGPNVDIIIGTHPLYPYVSTHPAFFSIREQAGFTFVNKEKFKEIKYVNSTSNKSVLIGNDVWIGANVKILEGVTVGDGAVVATGAVVTKDIEPYTINGGIPSRKIKNRFDEQHIDFLKEFKWWDKDTNWLLENKDLFCNIDEFVSANNKN